MNDQLIALASITVAMLWMVRAGTHYKLLRRRTTSKRCAACGRRLPCSCHEPL
jgi:hypothetical protein